MDEYFATTLNLGGTSREEFVLPCPQVVTQEEYQAHSEEEVLLELKQFFLSILTKEIVEELQCSPKNAEKLASDMLDKGIRIDANADLPDETAYINAAADEFQGYKYCSKILQVYKNSSDEAKRQSQLDAVCDILNRKCTGLNPRSIATSQLTENYTDLKQFTTSFLDTLKDAAEAVVIFNDHGTTSGIKFQDGVKPLNDIVKDVNEIWQKIQEKTSAGSIGASAAQPTRKNPRKLILVFAQCYSHKVDTKVDTYTGFQIVSLSSEKQPTTFSTCVPYFKNGKRVLKWEHRDLNRWAEGVRARYADEYDNKK